MVENQRKFRKLRLKEDCEEPIFCVDLISSLLQRKKMCSIKIQIHPTQIKIDTRNSLPLVFNG